ncbi:Zinc-finger domain of monoamine-oxidase A repressor R1 [Hirschfeldia incana]|nr:Zinc-finger domain of monoamine-oxidase A repressor R1 [Hirschfeldia incana]
MPAMSGASKVSIYEKCREERIKENLQRMQNLGIMDLSLKLKSGTQPAKRRYTKAADSNPPDLRSSSRNTPPHPHPQISTRRSSRLKNASPVTYFEEAEEKKGSKASKEVVLWIGEGGERPEIYTDEHERLLGNTERTWELFVDGYAPDGKRIYDPVRGKTCHQCRQKTLGYRTQCSKCHPSVTGQFCGDCLYMRYGEHVLETLENPDWTCPGCRGICNCSVCRKRKGWLPTGNAYKKVSKLGYKSVAHYLIQNNKQSETSEEDETDDSPSQASAKRSLSFKEAKESSEEDGLILQITDGREVQDDHIDDDDEGTNKNQGSARKSLSFLPAEDNQTSVIGDVDDIKPSDVNEVNPATPVIVDVEASSTGDKENGKTRGSKRKVSVEPNPNSIGGRLRQRRRSQA